MTWWNPSAPVLADVDRRWPQRSTVWDPHAAASSAEACGFEFAALLSGARFGVVAAGTFEGRPAVAKLSADPDSDGPFAAAIALAEFGCGPEVFLSDPANALLITERLRPGRTARQHRPSVAGLARVLSLAAGRAASPSSVALEEFLEPRLHVAHQFDVSPTSSPPSVSDVAAARRLLGELSGRDSFVHGDVSAGNIVEGGRRWWLLDPRGTRGDWHYDVAVAAIKCGFSAHELVELCDRTAADHEQVSAWTMVARAARV